MDREAVYGMLRKRIADFTDTKLGDINYDTPWYKTGVDSQDMLYIFLDIEDSPEFDGSGLDFGVPDELEDDAPRDEITVGYVVDYIMKKIDAASVKK